MFTIQKDLNGIFWHIYNNARSIVNVSDFDVVIDDVSNTFIIQCKNGSNIPNQAISISLIQVIDLSVGTSPILFSGANGLIQLLTAKGYTPYLQVPPSVSVVVYRVGQVGVFTMTPTQFTDNFTETGLGTNTMLGWALRNGNNGTKNQQGKFSLNKGAAPYDVIGAIGGSANAVLIGHSHEVGSYEKEGEPNTITYTNIGLQAGSSNLYKYTKKKGQSNTGADAPSEDGLGKNMPPYLIDVWVERVTELVINSGSGGSGAVDSVNGQTGVVIIPIPENTSDLVNDGSDGVNPFITAADLPDYDFQTVTDNGATTTNTVTFGDSGSGFYTEVANQGVSNFDTPNDKLAEYFASGFNVLNTSNNKLVDINSDRIRLQTSGVGAVEINSDDVVLSYIAKLPIKALNSIQTIAMLSDIGGGAVDSVNGQTGVVVLDAADVGAEPTKGSDDNYVTDAQLVVIGNTSGTNSGDNSTNTKYEVAATTGAVISFATPQIYNSIASPSSSNITDNLTGARIGVVQKIYHNAGTAPTFPAGWVRRGTGTYVTSTLNIIYAEWSVGTTVEYWITQ